MAGKTKDNGPKGTASAAREDRLKAALKANLARRKAQARARDANDDEKEDGDPGENPAE